MAKAVQTSRTLNMHIPEAYKPVVEAANHLNEYLITTPLNGSEAVQALIVALVQRWPLGDDEAFADFLVESVRSGRDLVRQAMREDGQAIAQTILPKRKREP
jgi:hypothetical protein